MFAMKKNIVNDAKRKMIAITFLVLFMTALICMTGALQSEINNRPDRAPVQTVEVSSDDVEEIVYKHKPIDLEFKLLVY